MRNQTLPVISDFLAAQIDRNQITHAEFAKALGIKSVNIVSQMKHGKCPVPLARLPAIARILSVDPVYLFRLWLNDTVPEMLSELEKSNQFVLTQNEAAIVDYIRDVSKSSDPRLDDDGRIALKKGFKA